MIGGIQEVDGIGGRWKGCINSAIRKKQGAASRRVEPGLGDRIIKSAVFES